MNGGKTDLKKTFLPDTHKSSYTVVFLHFKSESHVCAENQSNFYFEKTESEMKWAKLEYRLRQLHMNVSETVFVMSVVLLEKSVEFSRF